MDPLSARTVELKARALRNQAFAHQAHVLQKADTLEWAAGRIRELEAALAQADADREAGAALRELDALPGYWWCCDDTAYEDTWELWWCWKRKTSGPWELKSRTPQGLLSEVRARLAQAAPAPEPEKEPSIHERLAEHHAEAFRGVWVRGEDGEEGVFLSTWTEEMVAFAAAHRKPVAEHDPEEVSPCPS